MNDGTQNFSQPRKLTRIHLPLARRACPRLDRGSRAQFARTGGWVVRSSCAPETVPVL